MTIKELTTEEQEKYTEHIKVNLPAKDDDEKTGAGEGCYVLVTPEVKRAYDEDESGTSYEGVLDNDSLYYPGLKHGTIIQFDMRGEKRPTVKYNWLLEHYGEPAPEWTECAEEAQGMTIRELTPEQLTQVKQNYYTQKQAKKGKGVSWGELAQINDLVSDAEIYEQFEGVSFVSDDFS